MIISHKHKFIFLHVPKTAGSSVETSLIRFAGKNDIFIGGIKEAYQHKTLPLLTYINQIRSWQSLKGFTGSVLAGCDIGSSLSNAGKKHYAPHNLDGHSDWQQVVNHIGKSKWENYYKFAFERNPWDKMVSLYYWRGRNHNLSKVSFDEFVKSRYQRIDAFTKKELPKVSDWDIYADDDKVQVDFLERYETINENLSKILNECGVDFDDWLPNAKSQYRKNKCYRKYYSRELEEIVAELYAREINFFNYEF